jgi:hypothetical protein
MRPRAQLRRDLLKVHRTPPHHGAVIRTTGGSIENRICAWRHVKIIAFSIIAIAVRRQGIAMT